MEKEEQNQLGELALESLYNVPLNVSVVLGRTEMELNNLLKLSKGSVIELDRNVNEPVDVYVNDRMIARGEIVVVDNKIGITLTRLIYKEEKTK